MRRRSDAAYWHSATDGEPVIPCRYWGTPDMGRRAAGSLLTLLTHFDIQTVNWCSGSSTGVHRSAGPGASYCAAAELAIQAVARHISGFQFPEVSR
jgi:hypothetical protein